MLPNLDLNEAIRSELKECRPDPCTRLFSQRFIIGFDSTVHAKHLDEAISYSELNFRAYLRNIFYLDLMKRLQGLYYKCMSGMQYNAEIKSDFDSILKDLKESFDGDEN